MTTTREVTIFIAEDHVISRMGLKMLIEQTEQFKVIGEAEDGEAAVEKIKEIKPDVVMMDLNMPKLDGIEATRVIKKELPETRILIFTSAEDDKSIFAALKAGADGYCLKTISGELLAAAISSVLNGAAWLDPSIAQKVMHAQIRAKEELEDSTAIQSVAEISQSKVRLLSLIESGKSYAEISKELDLSETLIKGQLRELMEQLQGASRDKSRQSDKLEVGDRVASHYVITDVLGAGGMGMVYKAKHEHIDRVVAIKTMHAHLAKNEITLERFKKEAQATAAVVHPNLVTIHDFGIMDSKVPYIVMEYLEGASLDEILDAGGGLSFDEAIQVFIQICQALGEVHRHGIVHRDLKPSNVMIVEMADSLCHVKLVDFGIAKFMKETSQDQALTGTGEIIGSPPYISPEYVRGAKIDRRSDLYSLGCMMYEVFSGEPAFLADTPMDTLLKHINSEVDPLPLIKSEIPEKLQGVVFSLLEKDPENRPVDAAEVIELLKQAIA